MMKKSLLSKIIIVIVSTGNILCGIAIGAELSEDTSQHPNLNTSHTTTESTMVFDDKGSDHLLFCKRRFEITSDTVIKNEVGTEVTLDRISPPCKAKVSFYEKPGERNTFIAVSVEMLGKPRPQPE
jgi:hypothetical protein